MSYLSNCCLLSEQQHNVTSRIMKFFTGKREFLSTARGGGGVLRQHDCTYTSHVSAQCVVGQCMDARHFAAGCALFARARLVYF